MYTAREARRHGAGRTALVELMRLAKEAGIAKLVSRVFVENEASRALLKSVGFREVGVHERHGVLDGAWRDVVVVEISLHPSPSTLTLTRTAPLTPKVRVQVPSE